MFDSPELDTSEHHDKLEQLEMNVKPQNKGVVLDGQGCIDQLQKCDNSHSDTAYFTNVPDSNAAVCSLGGNKDRDQCCHSLIWFRDFLLQQCWLYFSENDEDLMYFYVATEQKSCPAFEMNCFEVLEMYLPSSLFFAFRSYLHPDANVGVDSSTTLP